MKWTKAELLRNAQNVDFSEDIEIDDLAFANNSGIVSTEGVHVDGNGYLNESDDTFYVTMHIVGTMICPDSITSEEVEVPFEIDTQETYSFVDTDEDGVRIVEDDEIDLMQAIIDEIIMDVPLQVTLAEEGDYPEGDGWKVYSEADYQKMQEEEIDPRLAKLKEFKEE